MSLFPVLVDEAIYLRWAEIIAHTHIWFISMLDAKPPLAYWVYAAARTVFADNPLLGNRLISVAAGVTCIWVLYRIGEICGGVQAGVTVSALYAVLPYGVFYDRIAYVDSLVNLCGALLVWAALRAFARPQLDRGATIVLGLTLGLGLFVKTTVLLFGLTPIAIGAYLWKGSRRNLAAHLGVAYGIAAIFPLLCQLATPAGPKFDVNNVLLHHTNFFTPLTALAQDPGADLRINARLLAGYAAQYLTLPLIAAATVASALAWKWNRLSAVILLSTLPLLAISMATLEYFPSRYAFPCVWPLLLVIACAAAGGSGFRRWAAMLAVATVAVCAAKQSTNLIQKPEDVLYETDAAEFLGSGPYSGGGVLEAISRLRDENREGPITILTDPWWGPPTDVVFAYLNREAGIRVFEAWWLQNRGTYPLVPQGPMPVWRSQYQRVPAGDVDFSATPELYYVTDTNYHTAVQVREMSPDARILQRFPKRGGREFIDIYKLR